MAQRGHRPYTFANGDDDRRPHRMHVLKKLTNWRFIIVHFHFFKNAGTSIETVLQRHFQKRFTRYEPGGAAETTPGTALKPFLLENEHIQAVSSHTICFPPPRGWLWRLFPIVFLRHPLDRILSMYNYEARQDSNSPGARLAREHGLGGYIEARLETPGERTLRNYQTWMLAQSRVSSGDGKAEFRAAARVLKRLPVVGVVDRFEESLRLFNGWLAPCFPGLKLTPEYLNPSAPAGLSMEQRLDSLKADIGDSLFRRIEQENALDLELYNLAIEQLAARHFRY